MVIATQEQINLILVKIQNNQMHYNGSFLEHTGKFLVPVGSRFVTNQALDTADLCEIAFVVEHEDNSKLFFIGELHDLVVIDSDHPVPDEYQDIAVDYYNLDDMRTVYLVKKMVEITRSEFLAYVGRYYQYHWETKEGDRKKFTVSHFLKSHSSRIYLSK